MDALYQLSYQGVHDDAFVANVGWVRGLEPPLSAV
jgi:hypothetical protein